MIGECTWKSHDAIGQSFTVANLDSQPIRIVETGDCDVQTCFESHWTEYIPSAGIHPTLYINTCFIITFQTFRSCYDLLIAVGRFRGSESVQCAFGIRICTLKWMNWVLFGNQLQMLNKFKRFHHSSDRIGHQLHLLRQGPKGSCKEVVYQPYGQQPRHSYRNFSKTSTPTYMDLRLEQSNTSTSITCKFLPSNYLLIRIPLTLF